MSTDRRTSLPMRLRRGVTAVACCAAVGAFAAGCSADGAAHNEADVAFVSGMLPHHEQALEMVELTESRDLSAEVSDLADEIRAAQAPEIETMESLLDSWGAEVSAGGGGGMEDMDGMDHSSDMAGTEMSGMMSGAEMSDLRSASDAQFEQLWLAMMVEHHRGAVDQARTEVVEGESDEAVDLARDVVESQTAEIDEMTSLLQD